MPHCRQTGGGPMRTADQPDTLTLCGAVPRGYSGPHLSQDILEAPKRPVVRAPAGREVVMVATDGGCDLAGGHPRAGWGCASDDPRVGNMCGSVRGPCQTAQRNEVCALVVSMLNAGSAAFLGRHCSAANTAMCAPSSRWAGITWVKAHLTGQFRGRRRPGAPGAADAFLRPGGVLSLTAAGVVPAQPSKGHVYH